MNMITEKTIGVKGIDGMAGLKVFSKQGAPQDQSHPEDIITGGNPSCLVCVNNPKSDVAIEAESAFDVSRGNGVAVKFSSDFDPVWGKLYPEDKEYSEVINYYENGERIIFFVIGGATIAEVQAIHQSCRQLNRSFLIGSTSIITPDKFTKELCILGEKDSKAIILPSILQAIENEKNDQMTGHRAKKDRILEELKKEQELMEERVQLDLSVLEKQKELEEKRQEIEDSELKRKQAVQDAFDNLDLEVELEPPKNGRDLEVLVGSINLDIKSPNLHVSPEEPILTARSTSLKYSFQDLIPSIVAKHINTDLSISTSSVLVEEPVLISLISSTKPITRLKSKGSNSISVTAKTLFEAPNVTRDRISIPSTAESFRNLARISISPENAISLSYNFLEADSSAASNQTLTHNLGSGQVPQGVLGGYVLPPRRHIPTNATTISSSFGRPPALGQGHNFQQPQNLNFAPARHQSYVQPNLHHSQTLYQNTPNYAQQQGAYQTQPMQHQYQQQASFNQPQTPYNQPQASFNQPQVIYGLQQAPFSQQQPAYAQQQSSYNQPQATYGQQQTSYGQQQPSYNQQIQMAQQPQYMPNLQFVPQYQNSNQQQQYSVPQQYGNNPSYDIMPQSQQFGMQQFGNNQPSQQYIPQQQQQYVIPQQQQQNNPPPTPSKTLPVPEPPAKPRFSGFFRKS